MSRALIKSDLQSVNVVYLALRQALILIIIYVVLLFLLPTDMSDNQYHLSALGYKTIHMAVSLPILLVWLAAFFGYAALHQYAQAIKETADGQHFERLAHGSAWLAWSLPISAIASLVLNSLAYRWPGLDNATVIVLNYIRLFLPLVAFSIIGVAANELFRNAKLSFSKTTSRYIAGIFLIGGILYCYLTFTHFDLSNLGSTNNPYHLPIWLMVITMVIPYLYAWFIGLLAAYEITLLSRHTRGILYRRGLQWLVAGLVVIIFSSIAIQYVSIVAPRSGRFVFDYRLTLIFIFRIIGGAGFLLLAWGALKLKKIEEV